VTAPRVCRRCGAALSPNVMWCTLCYEPVRQLTPRDRQLPTPPDLVPIDPAEVRSDHVWIRVSKGNYSRTAGGATSFGVMGRVILTAFVLVALAGLASAAFLSFLVGGWLLGIVLIRDIWKKQYISAPGGRSSPGRHSGSTGHSRGATRVGQKAPRPA
jgi:ribosomal protein L40E